MNLDNIYIDPSDLIRDLCENIKKKRNDSVGSDLSNALNAKVLDIFSVEELFYSDKIRNLDVQSAGEVKSIKNFPVFLDDLGKEQIFKPLSKTKPFLTPLFAYAEVFRSYVIRTYFDENAPLYQLAICNGISEDIPKYYNKGTLVNSVLQEGQKLINLLEYFRNNPDPNVDIDTYINYCMETYDYIPILKSSLFTNNIQLTEGLVNQILLSILMKNQNFHYENIAFIYEGESLVSLAPPIDHEFSSFFLFPEDMARFFFHDTLYTMSMTNASGKLSQNISFIVQNYPAFVKNFLDRLQNFKTDLLETHIFLGDSQYMGRFNSDDYKIGHERFKSKNENKATLLESNMIKYSIDTRKYENSIKVEILKNIQLFESLLTFS